MGREKPLGKGGEMIKPPSLLLIEWLQYSAACATRIEPRTCSYSNACTSESVESSSDRCR